MNGRSIHKTFTKRDRKRSQHCALAPDRILECQDHLTLDRPLILKERVLKSPWFRLCAKNRKDQQCTSMPGP